MFILKKAIASIPFLSNFNNCLNLPPISLKFWRQIEKKILNISVYNFVQKDLLFLIDFQNNKNYHVCQNESCRLSNHNCLNINIYSFRVSLNLLPFYRNLNRSSIVFEKNWFYFHLKLRIYYKTTTF